MYAFHGSFFSVVNCFHHYFLLSTMYFGEYYSPYGLVQLPLMNCVCYTGAPALAIGAALAVDYKAFDGTYVDCVFR